MPITPTYRSTETGVRLRVDDGNAVIDLGDHPDYPAGKPRRTGYVLEPEQP